MIARFASSRMTTWKRRKVGIAALVGMFFFATPAFATPVLLEFDFVEPGWGGVVTYEDTSGQPWTPNLLVTAYGIVSMNITDGIAVWDETDLFAGFDAPPNYGVLADPFGNFAFFAVAIDGRSLTSSVCAGTIAAGFCTIGEPGEIVLKSLRSILSLTPEISSVYELTISPIPEPNSVLLFSVGMLVVSRAVRRRSA